MGYKNLKLHENKLKVKDFQKKASKLDAAQKRKDMLAAGAYDGRFKNRTISDKKKIKDKYAARGYKYIGESNADYEIIEELQDVLYSIYSKTNRLRGYIDNYGKIENRDEQDLLKELVNELKDSLPFLESLIYQDVK
jgi:hypothetical protein